MTSHWQKISGAYTCHGETRWRLHVFETVTAGKLLALLIRLGPKLFATDAVLLSVQPLANPSRMRSRPFSRTVLRCTLVYR